MKAFLSISLIIACSASTFGQSTTSATPPGPAPATSAGLNYLDYLNVESRVTLMLDGGIRDITGGQADKTTTGLLGVRVSGLFTNLEGAFTAISGVEPVKSTSISDYGRIILNPYNAQSASFSGRFYAMHISKKARIASELRYILVNKKIAELYKINGSAFDDAAYAKTISQFDLKKFRKWYYRAGFMLEFNYSNTSWIDPTSDIRKDGNLISFNPFLTTHLRTYWAMTDSDVNFIFGVGPAYRIIGGDISAEPDFLKSVTGSSSDHYSGGGQITGQLFVTNFFAKFYYTKFDRAVDVPGLTNGQLYIQIGIHADIGGITRDPVKIRRLVGAQENYTALRPLTSKGKSLLKD